MPEKHLFIFFWPKLKNWASFSPSQTESTIHTAQAYSLAQPGGENRLDEILGS